MTGPRPDAQRIVRVEIWSDIVCPWCYVGSRRLERALESFGHDVEIVWRSYELDPAAPAERDGTYTEHLARKYGISHDDAAARLDHMVAVGAEVGADLRFDIARPGNTFDAHRLLHLGRSLGVQIPLKERLLAATFTEGCPVGDRETLIKLAADVGIGADAARRALEGDDFAAAVRADEAEAHAIGVRGVPFFVFDRRYAVSGAQPPEVLLEVLERAWREAAPAEIAVEGAACEGPDCAV
jgi:predicted DsbA family dithiol-disulfide isomerase